MTEPMAQMHDAVDDFSAALAELKADIYDVQRHASAYTLSEFPDRTALNEQAALARRSLHADAVEINAIYNNHQITIGGAPSVNEPVSIMAPDSLCVITVGVGHALAVNDIANDPITKGHATVGMWASWASAPVYVHGFIAGTVCALEARRPRIWTMHDQSMLEFIAANVTHLVEEWAP